ncbi:hypothetical protein C2G38_2138678 [Gigaspora rosea]|uniref:Uncharacterized protein n=1 Tax=Gigaspora rosea TaxID=44941 RepID=A0A397VSZ9_9GLOM|nr:hypothetical protein C2G38_2138678 [Gigaspora rosea]
MTNADNQPPSSIITMLILLEGKKSAVQIDLDQTNYKELSFNLDRLTLVLKEEFNELQVVERSDVEMFSLDDFNTLTPLHSGTLLTDIITTDISPLVVRYPFSDTSASLVFPTVVIVKYRLLQNSDTYEMPHSSGSWILLREAVHKSFEKLQTCDFYFVSKINSEEKKFENEFQFNKLMDRTDSNDKGERYLDLKIQIKGKKAYGDWTLKEVSKEIYNDAFDSIESMPIFEIEKIIKLDPLLNDNNLNRFENNLREKMNIFHNEVTTNEATAREFISVFLSLAVNHVRACNDPSTRLMVEVELDGSRGYGVLDYGIYIQKIPILVTEAKPHESEKAIAQTLVQIHSAAESLLGKRKRSEQTMFGIVTSGRSWRFIRWNGTLESPKAEITQEYPCIFENDMKEAKKVVSHIVRVLQAQASSLSKEKPCAKRLCTGDNLE